jgi:hypothetical protein
MISNTKNIVRKTTHLQENNLVFRVRRKKVLKILLSVAAVAKALIHHLKKLKNKISLITNYSKN